VSPLPLAAPAAGPPLFGLRDIVVLPFFGAATEQQDQSVAILPMKMR
jgi:hypothetical protein